MVIIMQITIRRMIAQDVPAVASIEREVFTDPWSEQGFYDSLQLENTIFLVAMEENTLCGYCGMYVAADEGEITNVAVAPAYRGRGIGEQIVSRLIGEGHIYGVCTNILEVRMSNESAILLYEKLGFKPAGIRRGFYEKPKEDALVMMR